MKSPFGLLLRPIGLANIGAAALAMASFTNLSAHAQKRGSSAGVIKQSTYTALTEAPTAARESKNPFESDPQAVAVGRKLFEQHCAECHGKNAGGTKKAPSLLREEVQRATPGTLFWVLTNGVVRQGMPVWSKLPEQQRWQLVTFLRSLNARPSNANQ